MWGSLLGCAGLSAPHWLIGTVNNGPGGCYIPVPLRPSVCGLVTALSVRVSVPFTVPAAAGENVTLTVQVAPAARLVPQVLLDTLKLALAATLVKPIAAPE